LAIGVAANKATEPKDMGPEKRLCAFSILYLYVLFAALVADRWLLA
jgi:protoheme IX farnesyltransferase